MTWVSGKKTIRDCEDINVKYRDELKDELPEDVARKTLGRFLKYNIGLLIFYLTGYTLEPYQRLMIKGWLFKNFSLTIAARGLGKSMMFAHFCYVYCLLHPGKRIVMTSATFRSSRKILEMIDGWSKKKRGFMLRQCMDGDMRKRPDLYEIRFKNGSSIVALPLGDGERLRGYRCSVLGIDEGLLIPQTLIDTVLKPFLIATPDEEVQRRQLIRKKEARLIEAGKMTEEERTKFRSDAKMVILSSASYTWQDLYTLYRKYLKIIYAQDDAMLKKLDEKERALLAGDKEAVAEKGKDDDIEATYLVHQISYRMANPDLIDKSIREEIESGMFSENTIKREYEAQFVQDSDGYFRAKVMEDCTLKGPNDPTVEIIGEKGAEYILSIDPNLGGSEVNDHFAMCVIKIIDKKFHDDTVRKVGVVVHQYANAGAKPEHHIGYFLYLLTHFNIVYVAVDTSQGSNMDFINFCNESSQFKNAKKNLQAIQYVDFGKETFDDLVTEIQRGYNLEGGFIVQKQFFHSTFQKAANEYMQTCFNRRQLLFAAKALPNEGAMAKMRGQDIGDIIAYHPDFVGPNQERGDMDDFIAQQDVLVDLVKKECALIEVKVSSLGNTTFDLPTNVKKASKNKNRIRRDSYSALFLGNWALKLYLESKSRPSENYGTFYAGWAV